jgi:hypothetical protein
MTTKAAKLRQIKEFARAAGVTVRTLHLYARRLLRSAAQRMKSFPWRAHEGQP